MLRRLLFKQVYAFSVAKQGGSLWTWGVSSLGSGIDQESQRDQLVPRRVDGFNNNVAKVVTGHHFSAVITTNGELYTFGQNNHGQLGVGSFDDKRTPEQVEFFRQHGLRVVDVALGRDHSVALTRAGGLGGEYDADQATPVLVEAFRGKSAPARISAGFGFTIVHDQKNDLWGWGTSSSGELGNGYDQNLVYPELNEAWRDTAHHQHVSISKIKSVGRGTVALLSNGNLFGWGASNYGNLGVRQQEFVRTDFYNYEPLEVNRKYMKPDEKVVDFDLSIDNLTILTDQNNVYFSGNDLYYVPYLVPRPNQDKVVKVASAYNSFAYLTESGDLWISNDFLRPFDIGTWGTLYRVPTKALFQGGKVLDIGGSYNVRYAIVQN